MGTKMAVAFANIFMASIAKEISRLSVSSDMRTIKTLYDLSSDWLLRKWSILIGRVGINVSWTGQRGNNRYSAWILAQPISFLSCTTPQLANWMIYVTICSSKTSRYDALEADTPVRVIAQRQRPHLARGSNRSFVSTAAARHASGASVFCHRIVSSRCHVPVMFIGCPNSPQRVFSMSLAISRHVC